MAEGKAPVRKPRKRVAKPEPTPEIPAPERKATSVESAPLQPNVEHCGYIGDTTDPEPDSTYTLSGVLGL